jgi:hypothetical protein
LDGHHWDRGGKRHCAVQRAKLDALSAASSVFWVLLIRAQDLLAHVTILV